MSRRKIHELQGRLPLRTSDETSAETAARMEQATAIRDGESRDPVVRGRRAAEAVLKLSGTADPVLPSADARELYAHFERGASPRTAAGKPGKKLSPAYLREQAEIKRNPWTK